MTVLRDSKGLTVATHLGYPMDSPDITVTPLNEALTLVTMERLNNIDDAIASAVLDSMAVEVSGLKVDYKQHLATLKSEGSRLLAQLGYFVNRPVYYDRFAGKYPFQAASFLVKSYW